jgi:hypothetical protein
MKKIINYINNLLFNRWAKQYFSIAVREQRFVSYDKAKTVLILFGSDYSEKNILIRKMISSLQQDGKKVSAWGFVNKKEIATSILPDFRILHHQQTNFFHKPVVSFVNELSALQFDLLIDLTIKPNLPLLYLAVYANASCKVGVRKSDLPIYDFMFDLDRVINPAADGENQIDETYLFNQIIFYLKSIQTKD